MCHPNTEEEETGRYNGEGMRGQPGLHASLGVGWGLGLMNWGQGTQEAKLNVAPPSV